MQLGHMLQLRWEIFISSGSDSFGSCVVQRCGD